MFRIANFSTICSATSQARPQAAYRRTSGTNARPQTEEQEPMTMMAQAPTARQALARQAAEPEPAELRHRRVRLSTGSAAAGPAAGPGPGALAHRRGAGGPGGGGG